MLVLCLAAFILTFSGISCINNDDVRLIVSKDILNEYIFEEKEMTVLYTIYNFHPTQSAKDVQLFDTYMDSDFTQIHGSNTARWSVILPSSNVTHAIVLIPHKTGNINMTSATITYKTNDLDNPTLSYSSAPGYMMIYRFKDYNKRFASHAMEWFSFVMIVTPCLLIPYMLWYSSSSKY